MTFYNDIDPKACAWTQALIDQGSIPPGVVACKSITEVTPDEIKNFTQCHFFNGVAGWAEALRLAGWPITRPVWCASLPCQPFSAAGKQKGGGDDRHLWPAFFNLVRECRPECIFGEQVAAAIGFDWLDGISADLEAEGYRVGAIVLGAHSVGAPQIRQRLYWVADRNGGQSGGRPSEASGARQEIRIRSGADLGHGGENSVNRLAHAGHGTGRAEHGNELQEHDSGAGESGQRHPDAVADAAIRQDQPPTEGRFYAESGGGSRMVLANGTRREQGKPASEAARHRSAVESASGNGVALGDTNGSQGTRLGPHGVEILSVKEASEHRESGFWSDYRIINTTDGKARRIPVEPVLQRMVDGISDSLDALRVAGMSEETIKKIKTAMTGFPLSDSVRSRVALLKGYGNAIVPEVAAEFIMACLDTFNDSH